MRHNLKIIDFYLDFYSKLVFIADFLYILNMHPLLQIKESIEKGGNQLVVFDLDSTLYDLSMRHLAILKDYAESHHLDYPEQCENILKIQLEHITYYPENIFRNIGMESLEDHFLDHFKRFWLERFFSNHYIQYDILEDGAKDWVDHFADLGAHISFLTGRDEERMGIGTRQRLIDDKLYCEAFDKSSINIKPHRSIKDDEYKSDYLLKIKSDFKKIHFIDNEPKNLVLIAKEHPEIDLIHFDSVHSEKADIPSHLPKIDSFIVSGFNNK